jgi:hypothetical protein
MDVSERLRRMGPVGASGLIARLGRFKFVFPLASSGYCAVHWLLAHSFSFYILSGALAFGAIAAVAVAWLSDRFSAPSPM